MAFCVFCDLTGRRISREDGLKALTADVGLIRVVVRREAPSNQRIGIRRPVSRTRSVRETSDYVVPHSSTAVELCGKTRPTERLRQIAFVGD